MEWFHPTYNWILGSTVVFRFLFVSACQKSTMSAAQEITATPMLDGLWNGWKQLRLAVEMPIFTGGA